MVRGVRKRVICLRHPDSKWFDEAFFVVSERAEREGDGDEMIREANRILGDAAAPVRGRRRRLVFALVLLFAGVAVGVLFGALLF